MKGLKINIKLASQQDIEISNQNSKPECSLIIDRVFLSGYKISTNLETLSKYGITHIINCASGSKHFISKKHENIEYLLLDIKDEPGFDLIYSIYKSIDFIENALSNKGTILIHCFEGISRGPSLLASYIMWKYKLTKDQAINNIKEKRKCIEINLGFSVQLSKWEELLYINNADKFFKIQTEGNISLVNKNELNYFKENDFKSVIVLFLHENILYKIFTSKRDDMFNDSLIKNKLDDFILLLQKYENYPKEYVDLNIEDHGFNVFALGNEEIIKSSINRQICA